MLIEARNKGRGKEGSKRSKRSKGPDDSHAAPSTLSSCSFNFRLRLYNINAASAKQRRPMGVEGED